MDSDVYEAPHTEEKGLSRWLPRSPPHQKKGFSSDFWGLLYSNRIESDLHPLHAGVALR